MSHRQFSPWLIVAVTIAAVGLVAMTLAGGVFLGYQWGRSAARVAQLEGEVPPQTMAPFIPLPDFAPFSAPGPAQPYLGLQYEPITADLAEAEDLAASEGVLVRAVAPGSPAAAAGIQAGDVIEKVNGQPLDAAHDLRERLRTFAPGDEINLAVQRGAQTLTLRATLGARPATLLPLPSDHLAPSQGWELYCAPPEPCRLIPAPESPWQTPSGDGKALQGLEKQQLKQAARSQAGPRSLEPQRARPAAA